MCCSPWGPKESDTNERLNWTEVLALACQIFCCRMGTLSCSMRDLVLWAGIEPRPLTLGMQILSHWTTREVPPVLLFLQKKEDWTLLAPPDLPRPPTLHPLTLEISFYLTECPPHEDIPTTSILQRELNMGNFLTKLSSHEWQAGQMQDLNPMLSASEACGPSPALTSTVWVWALVVLEAVLHSVPSTELVVSYSHLWQ